MKTESLQFLGSLDEGIALDVARTLSAVNGVAKVNVSTTARTVAVDFDEDATSTQELSSLLSRAGYPVRKPAHGSNGSCCGGCGGG